MPIITSVGYTVPIIEALSPLELFDTGANKPLLIRGVDNDGNKGDYVVKCRGAERMSPEACMRELLATFIAGQMNIPVVNPVIVNISQGFLNLLEGNVIWNYASKSLGYNFGSEYIKKFITIVPGQTLNDRQLFCA